MTSASPCVETTVRITIPTYSRSALAARRCARRTAVRVPGIARFSSVSSPHGRAPRSYLREGGVMSDGMRDKVEGKLKEKEGELTDDTMREKQGEAQQKWGEA